MQNSVDLIKCSNLKRFIIENEIDLNIVEDIYCSLEHITSLEGLNAPNLKLLCCSNNRITNLRGLNAPNLEVLYCGGNHITSLEGLNAPNIIVLYCGDNQIESLKWSNYLNLIELSCASNLIKNFEGLNCPNLEKLNCSYNEIFSFEGLNCPNLKELHYYSDTIKVSQYINAIYNPNSKRTAIYLNNKIYCGCFCGTVQQFIDAAIEKYGKKHFYVDWAKQFI